MSIGPPRASLAPTKGFSPQIGVLVSMMAFIRAQVLNCVTPMSTQDLDFLIDGKANTVGATLFHLAATETYYQLNTFEGVTWGSWPQHIKEKWDVPMNLGDAARNTIKGNSLDYYLTMLHETREKALGEFRKRDDQWLAIVEIEPQRPIQVSEEPLSKLPNPPSLLTGNGAGRRRDSCTLSQRHFESHLQCNS